MNLIRRAPRMALAAVTASLLALAFAGSALAATQNIGPYAVTDAVTNDGTNTTATYTITVPANGGPTAQAISHVDVGVCALDGRTYSGTRDTDTTDSKPGSSFGSYSASGDPSINNLNTPVFKWDGSQDEGKTYSYSYTVPGVWDPTPATLYIKSGSGGGTTDPHDAFSGTVKGIACSNTPPPENPQDPGNPPGVNNPSPTGQTVGQQVAGQQQVLGEQVEAGTAHLAGASGCQRKAFRVKVSGTQINKVVFTIDGKRVKKVSSSSGLYSIKVNPRSYKAGSHLVTAKVSFSAASSTPSKTLRVRFARCVRTAPAFTG